MSESANHSKHPGYKRWVFLFVLLGVGVHAGVFYLFTLDLKDPEPGTPPKAFVYYEAGDLAGLEDELKQRALLFDSEPLFLPTSRNFSGPIKTDASIWEPELVLSRAFEADIRWSDSLLRLEAEPEDGDGSPMELLAKVPRDLVSAFGTEKQMHSEKPPPGLFVEVWDSLGLKVLQAFLPLEKAVEMEFPLNPTEFSVLYTHYGVAGKPLLIGPSGNEETDSFVQSFIIHKVHPLLQGLNGYFRVKIGL